MPSPSNSLATLRPDLAASFMDFDLAMDRNGFVGLDILPVIEVDRQFGTYGRIPLAQLLQNRDTLRSPGSGYSRGQFTFETQTFNCTEHGAEELVDDREATMYRDYFDSEQISAMRALDAVVRGHEIGALAAIINAGIGTTGVGNGAWTGGASSTATPIEDVNAACVSMWQASGLWPNAMVIERRCFRQLRIIGEIVSQLKYAGYTNPTAKSITAEVLAQVFDIKYLFIAGSAKNSADEGQTATIASIWDQTKAMVCRVAETDDPKEPCVGRTFHWGEDGSSIGGTVESYRSEERRSDVIRVRHDVDVEIIYPQAAWIITGVQ